MEAEGGVVRLAELDAPGKVRYERRIVEIDDLDQRTAIHRFRKLSVVDRTLQEARKIVPRQIVV